MTETLLILSGGLGTRLQKELGDTPKSLVDINGKPFLDLLFEKWLLAGFRNFIFLLGHNSDKLITYLEKKRDSINKEILWIVERQQLGTGGAVYNAVNLLRLKEEFCLTNSDTWLTTDLKPIRFSKSPSIGVVNLNNNYRFGVVNVDSNNLVTNFREKSKSDECSIVNAGIYKFSPKFFCSWSGNNISLELVLLPYLVEKRLLNAVFLKGKITDIGIPEDLHNFRNNLLKKNESK